VGGENRPVWHTHTHKLINIRLESYFIVNCQNHFKIELALNCIIPGHSIHEVTRLLDVCVAVQLVSNEGCKCWVGYTNTYNEMMTKERIEGVFASVIRQVKQSTKKDNKSN
jgi:hypothetical protein